MLFPGVVLPITVGRAKSRAAAQEAARLQRPLGVLLQSNPEIDDPRPEDLHWVGTDRQRAALRHGPGRLAPRRRAGRAALSRAPVPRRLRFPGRARRAHSERRDDRHRDRSARALAQAARGRDPAAAAAGAGRDGRRAAERRRRGAARRSRRRADGRDAEEKQKLLETFDLRARLDKLLEHLSQRVEVLKLSREIDERTKESIESQKPRAPAARAHEPIQKELGEDDESAAELAELEKAIAEAGMPEEVEKQARKELKRLERMPEAAGEYSMVRTYLDWLIELPWKDPEAGRDRYRGGAAHPRRRPLRPRQDQEAHPRVPRGAQAQPDGQEPDPVLRRPARRGQDFARPEHRESDRARVRAREPGRRARRSGDPRAPAHLHRRAAGQHHPEHAQGGHAALP